jgi:hypothetical protein
MSNIGAMTPRLASPDAWMAQPLMSALMGRFLARYPRAAPR